MTRTYLKNAAAGEIERAIAGVEWREASSEGGLKPVEQRSEGQPAPAAVQPIVASRIFEIGSRSAAMTPRKTSKRIEHLNSYNRYSLVVVPRLVNTEVL